jgi:hypothetical protein
VYSAVLNGRRLLAKIGFSLRPLPSTTPRIFVRRGSQFLVSRDLVAQQPVIAWVRLLDELQSGQLIGWVMDMLWESILGSTDCTLPANRSWMSKVEPHTYTPSPSQVDGSPCTNESSACLVVAAMFYPHPLEWTHRVPGWITVLPYLHTGEGIHHVDGTLGMFEYLAYTKFVVDFYERLPGIVFMTHAHGGTSWHSKTTTFNHHILSLKDRDPDIPWVVDLNRNPGYDQLECSGGMEGWPTESRLQSMWTTVMGLGAVPATICMHCCSQLVMSRANIRRKPVSFYRALLANMEDPTLPYACKVTHHFYEMIWGTDLVFGPVTG